MASAHPSSVVRHPSSAITQLEFARAGIITEEMVYVAARENIGRTRCWSGRRRR